MQIIDRNRLKALSEEAAAAPRRRRNLNLHASYDDPCQRLLNALEPGTYIRPHRHCEPPKPECFLGVAGRMALVTFADDGAVTLVLCFGPEEDVVAVDLPPGGWHTVVSLASGSVFFETKPGPYVPLSDKDFAPWAPEEGTPEAEAWLAELMTAIQPRLA